MRRIAIVILFACVALWPVVAGAKGSALRFREDSYPPGSRAVAIAEVETWPASGQPEDGPFRVYLVRGGPLHFGHLPPDAPRVGVLMIGDPSAEDRYPVKVVFEVPVVPDGDYWVWVCGNRTGGTGCLLGFGDLVYGRLVVAREQAADPPETRPVASANGVRPTDTARNHSAIEPSWWAVVALFVLVGASGSLLVRVRRRPSKF